MATVDVDPLVTATFTPTLPVTTDGSTLTQADLTNTVVSLANRIEFLRTLSAEATETPEVFCTLREDWLDADIDNSRQTVYGVIPWTSVAAGAGSGGLSITHTHGSPKNPGGLRCSVPGTLGDDEFSFFCGPGAGSNPFSFATFDSMTIVAKIATDSTVFLTPNVRCGLAQNPTLAFGGTDSLGLFYGPAFGINWLLMKRVAGVSTTVVLAPMVIGEHIVVLFQKNAAGDVEVFVNGVLTTTVALAALPTGACTFGAYQGLSGAEGATVIAPVWDLMTLRTKPNVRSGP